MMKLNIKQIGYMLVLVLVAGCGGTHTNVKPDVATVQGWLAAVGVKGSISNVKYISIEDTELNHKEHSVSNHKLAHISFNATNGVSNVIVEDAIFIYNWQKIYEGFKFTHDDLIINKFSGDSSLLPSPKK